MNTSQNRDRVFTRHVRKVSQELGQLMPRFDVVDERPHGHLRAGETRLAAKPRRTRRNQRNRKRHGRLGEGVTRNTSENGFRVSNEHELSCPTSRLYTSRMISNPNPSGPKIPSGLDETAPRERRRLSSSLNRTDYTGIGTTRSSAPRSAAYASAAGMCSGRRLGYCSRIVAGVSPPARLTLSDSDLLFSAYGWVFVIERPDNLIETSVVLGSIVENILTQLVGN